MTDNAELAARLEEFADLLDAKDVEYKPRAYRRAAENVAEYPGDVVDLAEDGVEAVQEIDRVGEAIADKLVEYVETGAIEELEDLRAELPVEMDALTSVEGVGPKTVGTLYEALGIQTLDDLEAAAEAGEIQNVSGFGAKTEQNILDGIDFAREAHERQLLGEARPRGERVREYLRAVEAVQQCELGGSLRRWKPTIGDVDALVASTEGPAVVEAFTDWEGADRVIEAGDQKASVRSGGVRIDLRVVDPAEFGAALQYFTGSKDHNVDLRNRAIDRDLKLNEYGVFDISAVEEEVDDQRAGERVAGESEAEVYGALDLPWIPPELRENRGEIAAADAGELPELIETDEIRGDLHVHTEWSDGNNTIEEMAAAAAERGDEYVCITDHATGPGMVGGVGLSDDELREQREAIAAVDEARDDITVLAGVEANIDTDGGISVGDEVLESLDLVVASPHAGLDGDGTDRLIEAARHPAVDVIGHPTGRQLNRRPGLDVDVSAVAKVAAENDTALEVNANPHRLDLEGSQAKRAIDAGATIAIDTDAHRPEALDYRRFGVHTARRGWAEDVDVLNTRSAAGLNDFLE
ncbi:DNA polymerase IV (family X) [Halorhabdus sp. SVX81]|uniref:DNA polymerase/3'-5' exonuclease PolX n=1 Tax=Halorhabdus sp. SVX81 TaxID=2978283 RepID=UPI0023D9CE4B|nr:DNA polymerase/3'-5' exonuclease PolX [Halorhabdus sp. SVX81]WEL18269.1 DNA polymerase IV (family X) [Halorhabdus sp. SVX81]